MRVACSIGRRARAEYVLEQARACGGDRPQKSDLASDLEFGTNTFETAGSGTLVEAFTFRRRRRNRGKHHGLPSATSECKPLLHCDIHLVTDPDSAIMVTRRRMFGDFDIINGRESGTSAGSRAGTWQSCGRTQQSATCKHYSEHHYANMWTFRPPRLGVCN